MLNDALLALDQAETMEELRKTWETGWPAWKGLGAIEKRQLVARKEERKLSFGLEAMRRNAGDADIPPVIAVTVRELCSNPCALPPSWEELANSTLTDMDVVSVEESLFLYAYRLMETSEIDSLLAAWEKVEPFWRGRLPSAAYAIVKDLVHDRVRQFSAEAFRRARHGTA